MECNKVVINLPERTERLAEFFTEFRKLFNGGFYLEEGIRKEPVHLGIAEAHLNCIRNAKRNGWDKVLIMEDDLMIPSEKAKEYFNEAMQNVPKDWDVLLGGVYWLGNEVKVNKYWKKVAEFCSLHFYLVSSQAYDKLLTYDGSNHIDRWIGTQGLNVYCTNKYFALQKDGYSDNVQKVTDYNKTRIKRADLL